MYTPAYLIHVCIHNNPTHAQCRCTIQLRDVPGLTLHSIIIIGVEGMVGE